VQNFKYENDGNGDQLQNNADELQALQTKLFASEFIQEIVQTKSRDGTPKPPCVILYTDEQIAELRALCMTRNNSQNVTTMGVDRTFNLGPCYVTTVVYKNTKLIRKTTRSGLAYFPWSFIPTLGCRFPHISPFLFPSSSQTWNRHWICLCRFL